MTWTDAIVAALAVDDHVQVIVAITALGGTAVSVYLTRDAWAHYRAVRSNGATRAARLVAYQGVITQSGIALAQFLLACISLAVMTLPPMPTDGTMPPYVLGVILLRKLSRLAVVLSLAGVAITSARTRQRVHDILGALEHKEHGDAR